MEEDEEDEYGDAFVLDVEDVNSHSTVVCYYTCPECGVKTRFTARDERADGSLACPGPGCNSTITMTGERLSDGQRKLDDMEKAISDQHEKF